MKNIFKIAWRNLFRYQRRTLLTGALIAIGVIFMIVFSGVGNSFKMQVTGELTNANLGDLQIHAAGFLDSIDSNPLEMTLSGEELQQIEQMLNDNERIKAYSKRIRFGGMLSNFETTVGVHLTAIIPEMESETCPGLPKRILDRTSDDPQFLNPGEVLVPENIAKGLQLEVGSDVVLVATNNDGSVNGINLRVGGISENLFGPTGRETYMHLDDARTLLRIEGNEASQAEISEIAIKLERFDTLKSVFQELNAAVSWMLTDEGRPIAEVHTWEQLTPFKSVANMIDLLIAMIRVVLIAIVLISVMNVMLMSVYERISEIGTIASIGTPPGRILSLFLVEGFSLGLISSIAGSIIGMGVLVYFKLTTFHFTMGMIEMTLAPDIPLMDVLMTIGLVVMISVISGFQPALKASRLEPVEALRHV